MERGMPPGRGHNREFGVGGLGIRCVLTWVLATRVCPACNDSPSCTFRI